MTKYVQKVFTGERALFCSRDVSVIDCTFEDGESPFKESKNISADGCLFKWKYPFWYCEDVSVERSTFFEMARAGMWYTKNIRIADSIIEAPKGFRRSDGICLENVTFSNAAETLWTCKNVSLKNVFASRADYFMMNCDGVEVDGLDLVGNYSFDGAKNVVIRNSKLLTKDAFWNSENITVYDSFISGEYLGWNSKDLTLINCTVESLQGMCYIDNIKMVNCKTLNTTLSFEYSTADVDVKNKIDSVKNPASGVIRAEEIGELIMESERVDTSKTKIITKK